MLDSIAPQFMLYLALVRSLVFLISALCIWLGYRLFQQGVFPATGGSELEIKYKKNSFTLKNAAPGTLFALFGAGLLCFTFWQSSPQLTLETIQAAQDSSAVRTTVQMRGQNQAASAIINHDLQYDIQAAHRQTGTQAVHSYVAILKRLESTYNGIAWQLHQQGENKQALPYAQLATTLFPENAGYHDTLARVAAALQDYDLALQHAQLAAQQDGRYAGLPEEIRKKMGGMSEK